MTGSLQANEVLKSILIVGKDLSSHILIIDLLNLKFRKVLFKKRKGFKRIYKLPFNTYGFCHLVYATL